MGTARLGKGTKVIAVAGRSRLPVAVQVARPSPLHGTIVFRRLRKKGAVHHADLHTHRAARREAALCSGLRATGPAVYE
jgi:hypothetical protein